MKYFRNEKMESMTVRTYSLTKIICFSLGILFGLSTPKQEKRMMGNLTLIALLGAGLYALSEVMTCTLHIGFSSEDDDDFDWDEDEEDSLDWDEVNHIDLEDKVDA